MHAGIDQENYGKTLKFNGSGQIIATLPDLTTKGGLAREISYFREM